MPNGIHRYEQNREGTMYRISGGQWVRFSDVQDRLEAADRLAEAVEVILRHEGGRSHLDAALAAYRKEQEK